MVRGDVVEDEDHPGSSGASWGGLLLRRTPCTGGGDDLAIEAEEGLNDSIEVAKGAVGMRERSWRAQFSRRGPPFIGAGGGRGAELGSPASSSVQGCEEARDGRVRLLASWRG